MKAVDDIIVSTAETTGGFNTVLDAVNLHRLTVLKYPTM